ncbi:MAG: FKBP-type peptidyl-prolyl cis-trans isomerase [Planctomycetes bacterium]|nr:FKBP-type peptidyl-prolyl cis-trans isomerase [Planctomycetota bacterium]
MKPLPSCVGLLLFALAGCGGENEGRKPASASSARAWEAHALELPPDAPPALSAAEEQPGTPLDLGDGLLLTVEQAGSGTPAHAGSRVQLNYELRAKDEEAVIASTDGWDAPFATVIGGSQSPRLLPALERALTGLRAGCRAKLEVPAALGYGKDGPPAAADKALVFQFELTGVDG